jgi:hypothetical protein
VIEQKEQSHFDPALAPDWLTWLQLQREHEQIETRGGQLNGRYRWVHRGIKADCHDIKGQAI